MSNKTYIPAFTASVGDWKYYICTMKYAEVARQVNFAYDLGANKDLASLIQRGISSRTGEITKYLLTNEHRFLGAMIVAAWGGHPEIMPLSMEDPEGYLTGVDSGFGVLTFDGTQQYFALDGQHRLRAIKDAVKKIPELGNEDICVLIVPHYDTDEGQERTKRLFTNINRNAKSTTSSENIALDVDDGFAVLSRRFINEHRILSREGVVRVFTRHADEGDIRLASKSVPKTDRRALTTITVLYEMLRNLSHGLDPEMKNIDKRPSDNVLDSSYEELSTRIEGLLHACGKIDEKLAACDNVRTLRAPKGCEETGHAFMRPVVQLCVTDVAGQIVEQHGDDSWGTVLERLSNLDWLIGSVPWNAVYNSDEFKMLTGKEFQDVLKQLLFAHLMPPTKQAIKRARSAYKTMKGITYPVAEEDLTVWVPTVE